MLLRLENDELEWLRMQLETQLLNMLYTLIEQKGSENVNANILS